MNFKIIVYENDHPPPNCHLRRSDGTETRVAIPSMRILTGKELSKNERNQILEQIDDLCDRFDQFNPAIHKKEQDDE